MTCIWVTSDLRLVKAKGLVVVNLSTEFNTAGHFLLVEALLPTENVHMCLDFLSSHSLPPFGLLLWFLFY